MTFQADANEEAEMIIRAIMQASKSFLSISWEFFKRFMLQNKFATIFQISFNSKNVISSFCKYIDILLTGGGGQIHLLQDGGRPRDCQQADQEEEVEKDRPEPIRHFCINNIVK